MNRPESELAKRIVHVLNDGVDRIEPATRDRLIAARNTALSHYRERPEALAGLAWAGSAAAFLTGHRFDDARHLIAIAAMVLALVGIAYWQSMVPVNEVAEIDTGLLTDELPINAYLDKGFDSWLKRSPR